MLLFFFIENSSNEAFEMEETLNFDVLTCSQGSDLGQEQLNDIEQKAKAKSIKKATEWGLKKFDKWCEERAIKVDLFFKFSNILYLRSSLFYCHRLFMIWPCILMIMIITRLLSGILFICGPRSIICTLAPLGRK